MKTFRKLFITLNGYDPENFIKKLQSQPSQHWYHNVEKDRHIEELDAMLYCFSYSENADNLPSALLYLMEKQKGILSVTNILPTEKYELSFDEYNGLLLSFHDELVVPTTQQTLIQTEITPPEIKLEEFIPKEAIDSLEAFSSSGKKSIEIFQPYNQQRWFEFLTTIHRNKAPLSTELLEKKLQEDGWSEESAVKLGIEYEFARDLLKYYEAH
jgi:hypothetical protein